MVCMVCVEGIGLVRAWVLRLLSLRAFSDPPHRWIWLGIALACAVMGILCDTLPP